MRSIEVNNSPLIVRALLAVLSATLFILSFPGFNLWIFAWVAFVPLFFAIEGVRPLKAFLISYMTGFIFFLGTMYWLIHVTLPGMLVVVAYLSLYFGFFGLMVVFVMRNFGFNSTGQMKLLLVPAAWVSLEWIRSQALTGFGWNLLAYSQSFNLPIIQIADITGAYGVSFLIVLANLAIFLSIKKIKGGNIKDHSHLIVAVILILASCCYGIVRLKNIFTGEKIKVAIVQGNIPQDEKWDSRFAEMIMDRYEDLTKRSNVEGKADLVIWPETSIPGFVQNDEELFLRVKRITGAVNTPLLAGAPRYTDTKDGTSYYNSAFLFLKDGTVAGSYDKVHLVPFGEYVPFGKLLSFVHRFAPRPIGDCAAGKDYAVFDLLIERGAKDNNYTWKLLKKVKFSCLICFEDVFPDLARRFAGKNIDFLVNITNDAWFKRSSAAYQHAQASVFRAVENRINVLRSANTGLSCFIDQKGRITARVAQGGKDLFVSGFREHEIILSRARTVYTVYGDVFAFACIFFVALSMVKTLRRKS